MGTGIEIAGEVIDWHQDVSKAALMAGFRISFHKNGPLAGADRRL